METETRENVSPSRSSSAEAYTPWALLALLCLTTLLFLTTPWRAHIYWVNYLQDDVFYYLQIARNLANGHGSTFNRLAPTNGYHPLWLIVLTGFMSLGGGTDRLIPPLLTASMAISTIATYLLSFLLLSRAGIGRITASILALFCAEYALYIYQAGMEVILTIPLVLLLLWIVDCDRWLESTGPLGFRDAVGVGLLSSLVILSRIDAIIFLTLLGSCLLLQPAWRSRLRWEHSAGLLFGLLPVLAYVLTNLHFFHVLLPISGLAKQLKTSHGFTAPAWISFLGHPRTFVGLLPIIFAAIALPWRWNRLDGPRRAVIFTGIYFPFLYVTILSWLSDWPLWGWYFYMLRPAMVASFMVLVPMARDYLPGKSRWPKLLVFLFVITTLRVTWKQEQPELIEAAFRLQAFSQTHPGTYAMGDRSGVVGYLLKMPVVQLEGLTMDKKYLDMVRDQLPLQTVLDRYGVDYYVGSSFFPLAGCFHAIEPSQGGVHSPHLTGQFCGPPELAFQIQNVQTVVYKRNAGNRRSP